jgi:hypothetical protein
MATKETKAVKMGAAEKVRDHMADALKEHSARFVILMKCGNNGNGNGNGCSKKRGTMIELKDKRLITVDEFKKLYLNHKV